VSRAPIAGLLSVLLLGASARADDPSEAEIAELQAVIRQLEQRLAGLEQADAERVRDGVRAVSVDAGDHWSDRVRLGGSASFAYQDGDDGSVFDESAASVWDLRLFVDADLTRELEWGEQTLTRGVGFSFEWDFVRIGQDMNQPGEVYADLRGVLDRDWLNLQIGRFQLPFGEGYQLYSRGYADRPFFTNPVAAGWWWDEGVRIHGDFGEGRLGYVFAWTNGESMFQSETDSDKATTLRLWARPFPSLELSLSGHRTGRMGSSESDSDSAIWFGESWIRPLGDWTDVPVFTDGVIVPDGSGEFDGSSAVEADLIWRWRDRAQLWLGYGGVGIEHHGDELYDRDLRYWIAELVLQGRWLARELAPFYAGLRANGLGTYDDDEGYLLDFRFAPVTGYNMSSLEVWSLVLGWRLSDQVILRAEYSLVDVDLVRGVPQTMQDDVADSDSLALELGVRF
jgi:hypothetical protein